MQPPNQGGVLVFYTSCGRCVYLKRFNIEPMVLVITAKKGKGLRQQMQELLDHKVKNKKTRWDLFFGKVTFEGSPVDYQRNLRDE